MNKYELTYIIDPRLDDNARKDVVDRFNALLETNGAIIEKVDETIWGKRRLAYAINDLTEGYYVLISFKAESAVPREIERNLQNSDKILRYLIIKIEEKRTTIKPRAEKVKEEPKNELDVTEETVIENTVETVSEEEITE